MSLRWRITGVLSIVVALTVAWNLAASYYAIERQFDAFVSGLERIEASSLARQLSRAYTAAKGWGTVDTALSALGYQYDEQSEHREEHESGADGDVGEGFHIDRIRVVIVDLAGRSIRDNFAELEVGKKAPALSGPRREIKDLQTGQTMGFVYLDVNQNFLETESSGFLHDLLLSFIASGLFILIIAMLLAASLSRRITAPIAALTSAARALAQRDDVALLPVNSNDELGQMSATFNQMSTALQRQRAMRKRLINDVSHELNTPLTVVQLEAKALLDDLQEPDQAAQNIIQEVAMLRNLVNDLSWLAETDSGELQLHVELCDISELLISEVERWQAQAQAKHISLSLNPLPPLPASQLDPARIRQAMGNIILNALQHSEAGRVTVAVRSEPDNYAVVSVTDDGAGIDPSDLPHIFERFYRAEHLRSHGRGLGLDIARTIVEAHGGALAVNSEGIGCGATVEARLPSSAEVSFDSDPKSVGASFRDR